MSLSKSSTELWPGAAQAGVLRAAFEKAPIGVGV